MADSPILPPSPCNTCPYRVDTPPGVWAPEEYQKLPRYDGQSVELAEFHCHQEHTSGAPTYCRGWVSCHGFEALAIRLACASGRMDPAEVERPCPVPLYRSGREDPMLFSSPMVRALAQEIEAPGTGKTQTRRLVKGVALDWLGVDFDPAWVAAPENRFAPYGYPGNQIWVREAFYCDHCEYPNGPVKEMADLLYYRERDGIEGRGKHGDNCWTGFSLETMRVPWRPSLHMPRWASRISLEVTEVRIERLQDISAEDARAEGLSPGDDGWPWTEWQTDPRNAFSILWDAINGKRAAWASNPWVWVYQFRPFFTEPASAPEVAP